MRSDTRTTRWTRVIRTALVFVLSLTVYVQANPDDYYVYGYWNLGASGNDYLTGIGGYVDTAGITGWGAPGDEYVVFAGGPSYSGAHYAYVYRVETAGDRNQHPSNVGPDGIAGTADDAIGPIAPRTFTQIGNPFYLGSYRAGHENDFQIDSTGIYYGASPGWSGTPALAGIDGIRHYDFDWDYLGMEVPVGLLYGQTLGRNSTTGEWWAGDTYRQIFKWDGSEWDYQFTHPNLGGGHHDGMEVIGDSIYISDMTSDIIYQYQLDAAGNVIDSSAPTNIFTYSSGPPVEGMGFGPNQHIWISGWNSYTIYELGGGRLQEEINPPIPAPGAILLGTIGFGVVGWLRRRRTL